MANTVPPRQLEAEGFAHAKGNLRCPGDEIRARDRGALPHTEEDFIAGPVFPAIAQREAKTLADVVVLHLEGEVHVGREVQHRVESEKVDVDMAGRETDERAPVSRYQLEIGVRTKGELGAQVERPAVIEAAARDFQIEREHAPIERAKFGIKVRPAIAPG